MKILRDRLEVNFEPQISLMKRVLTPILLLAAILLPGCSTLSDGPVVKSKFPAESFTAKLKFEGDFQVTRINGRPVESRILQSQMKLVPGTHEIGIVAREYNLEGVGTIPLTAREGQTLAFTTERNGAILSVDVWDITDQQNKPIKIARHTLEIQNSSFAFHGDRANNDTNGNKLLGR